MIRTTKRTQKVSNHLIKRPRSLEIKIIMCIFASMKQAIVYNLTDFAAKYQLNDIFGAYAAHLMVSDNDPILFSTDSDKGFDKMVRERTLFTKLISSTSCATS